MKFGRARRKHGIGHQLGRRGKNAKVLPPSAGLEAWYRLGVSLTLVDGGVDLWDDSIGFSSSLFQSVAANRPLADVGNRIQFDGVNDYLQANSVGTTQTVYIRLKANSWTAGDCLFDGETPDSVGLVQAGTTPQVSVVGAGISGFGGLTIGQWRSLAFGRKTNGTENFIQVSGGAETAVTAAAMAAFTQFNLASRPNGLSDYAHIDVAEILLYSTTHSQAVRDQILAYLDTVTS